MIVLDKRQNFTALAFLPDFILNGYYFFHRVYLNYAPTIARQTIKLVKK
jgi:hypothetical protein